MAVSRSQLQVDKIEHSDGTSPAVLSFGATCVSGSTFVAEGGFYTAGIITAANFSGDGSALSNVSIAQTGAIIALAYVGI